MHQKYGRSPYLSATKNKQATFFPRIHKQNPQQGTRLISNSLGKRTCIDVPSQREDSCEKAKNLNIQQIINSRHYKQKELQIAQLERRFLKQMEQIQQRKKNIESALEQGSKNSYDHKYIIWELRNQILELETILRQQQAQNANLLYDLGYVNSDQEEQQAEEQEQPQDGEEGEPQ